MLRLLATVVRGEEAKGFRPAVDTIGIDVSPPMAAMGGNARGLVSSGVDCRGGVLVPLAALGLPSRGELLGDSETVREREREMEEKEISLLQRAG